MLNVRIDQLSRAVIYNEKKKTNKFGDKLYQFVDELLEKRCD